MANSAQANDLLLPQSHQNLLDGRLSDQFRSASERREQDAANRIRPLETRYTGPYRSMAEAAARKHQIPESLFTRLVTVESNWNPTAVSHAGAIGLAQLMPGTAAGLGVNPRDPKQNLEGGARYLRQQFNRFQSWRLALAAYNAGPEAVTKYNGIPPFRETQNYVKRILGPAQ